MRSRTVREGSVGLFVLLGIATFGMLMFWLQGVRFGEDSYEIIIRFDDTNGMREGGTVRYRGMKVGTIEKIRPDTNGIFVTASISPPSLLIPKKSVIVANQSGLVSETVIDITPLAKVPNESSLANPLSSQCNETVILCDRARLEGETGLTINDAVDSTVALSEKITDPVFFRNVQSLTGNASVAAAQLADLGKELTLLSKSIRAEIGGVSETTRGITNELRNSTRDVTQQLGTTTNQVNRTVAQVGDTASQFGGTATQATRTAAQFGGTAEQFSRTAEEYRRTAIQLNRLSNNLNAAIVENRASIAFTLDNISATSSQLEQLMANANETLLRVNASIEPSETQLLIQNLQELTANASAASANLREMSDAFNDPESIVALQRTLSAARATFENAQKITSDLDQLTGDPEFRQNLLRLVDGLSGLVSSTEDLEENLQNQPQTEVASPQPSPSPSRPSPSTPVVRESPPTQPQTNQLSSEQIRQIFHGETE